MISGKDTYFPTSLIQKEAMHKSVVAIIKHWENFVIQDGKTGDNISLSEIEDEIFVYKDLEYSKIWDEDLGPHNTMIHVLYTDGFISVVVDSVDVEMSEIFKDIQENI